MPATIALGLCGPIATWYLIGESSEAGVPPDALSYEFRAPDLPAWADAVAASTSVAATAVAAFILVTEIRAMPAAQKALWIRLVSALGICGAFLGWSGRALTAGTPDTNIPAGMVLLFGPVIVPACLLVLLLSMHGLRRLSNR